MDSVKTIVYWRNPLQSGIVAIVGLTILLSLSSLSFISFMAYAGMALFCCTSAWLIHQKYAGSNTMNTPSKNFEFLNSLMNSDFQLPRDKVVNSAVTNSVRLSNAINHMRRCVMLENYMQSAKVFMLLLVLLQVGQYMNLLTLVTLVFVFGLTLPKIYVLKQKEFDVIFDKVKKGCDQVTKTIENKMGSATKSKTK